ncbi:MAG: DUF5655 domain-containing protein [Bacilli bacterium]
MIIKDNKELKQKDFINEKELQNYFEKNLSKILDFQFIDTEFAVGNFRIDTLAFDNETNAFRILEYKNIRSRSLVDQGYTYLKLLLERKADFILKYNEKTNSNLRVNDVDWTQSRIVFVSPSYTEYQLNATDFKNIPFDLIRVTKYENDIVDVDFIKKYSNVNVNEFMTDSKQKEVNQEVVVYTEEDHLSKLPDNIRNLYESLKSEILELDDIDIVVQKHYISFKGRTNIIDVVLNNSKLKIYINMKKGTLEDYMNIAKDISSLGHLGNGDYEIDVFNVDDIYKVIPLIKQSIIKNKK